MSGSAGNTERLGAPYAWFLASGMSWYGTWGMQHVLFSWLVVGVLREDPALVGIAQMLMSLPALFIMPLAGSLADRFGRRRSLKNNILFSSTTLLFLNCYKKKKLIHQLTFLQKG